MMGDGNLGTEEARTNMKSTSAVKGGATKSKAKKPMIDPMSRVDLATVDAKVVDHYLEKLGLPVTGSPTERVQRLQANMIEHCSAERKATCDCGGVSDDRLVRCPFCGDAEADAKTAKDGAAGEAKAVEELRVKVETPSAPPGAPEPEDEEPVSGDAPPVAALATLGEGVEVIAAATVANLDASVETIRALYRTAIVSIYDLGVELRSVFANKLFLQRRDAATGAPLYESWTQFVTVELAGVCTVQSSYLFMAVAKEFTRAQVVEHGPWKLNLLLRVADPVLRAELEQELPGLTVRQLQAKVTASAPGASRAVSTGMAGLGSAHNAAGRPASPKLGVSETLPFTSESGAVVDDPLDKGIEEDGLAGMPEAPSGKKAQAAPEKAKQKPTPPPAPNPGVATTFLVGRVKVPLYARLQKKGVAPKPAKKLGDDPHGEVVLPNGVKLSFKLVQKKNGELELLVDVAKEG
jgi:hypothetical protein